MAQVDNITYMRDRPVTKEIDLSFAFSCYDEAMQTRALAQLSLAILLSAGSGCRTPGLLADPKADSSEMSLSGVMDMENRMVNPFAAGSSKAIVFIFIGVECPISNRYAPEIERLYHEFESQNISFWLVYPDPDASPQDIARHTKDYRLTLPVLRDFQHSLVRRAHAHVTPEAAIFSPAGREVYHGRIDDRMVDFGKERSFPTRRDVQAALESIIAEKPINEPTATAVGCPIPEVR